MLEKGLEEVAKAKAKLNALDEHLAKVAESFGPEGKAMYEALKKKASAVLKKGVAWLKKKFGEKIAAKRAARAMRHLQKRSWA